MDTVPNIRNVASPQARSNAMLRLASSSRAESAQSKYQQIKGTSARQVRASRPELVFAMRHFGVGVLRGGMGLALGEQRSSWSWLPPALWRCPRCSTSILTREAGPMCPRCHFREGT
jgi:rubrerythrin